jgi:hypothetical protein
MTEDTVSISAANLAANRTGRGLSLSAADSNQRGESRQPTDITRDTSRQQPAKPENSPPMPP